ncbi:MAG: DUF937 domain-containing protein [Lachnospiraceae bacterium]|nr:DUF937 domain-containing protein [Lachnospiraceae bacterium]
MDFKKLAGTLLSADSINGLSNATGASAKDVTSVLTNALPSLLNGAKDQANGKDTTEGFVNALSQHAQVDTKDLNKFLGNVDMKDGGKIIGHLLGAGKNDTLSTIATQSGVSQNKTNDILSALAPLLMSLLGQQTQSEESTSPIGGLFGSLLDNVDMGNVLTGLLGSSSTEETNTTGK